MDIFYNQVWQGDGNYARHRIPGMIVTDRGTLLIYNEARRTTSDWSMMNISMKRSTDHGHTFGEEIMLAEGTETHPTVNNPVMMQDKNGRIHFLHCEDYTVNGGRVLHRYSDDDGLTWSEPQDITGSTRPDFRNCFALGPGHGICTSKGTLLVPCWMVPKSYQSHLHSHAPSVISTLYSEDNGASWQLGDILGITPEMINPNETVAAELPDGRIYLNIRLAGGICYRGQALSADGHSGWQDYRPVHELIDPECFGSVCTYRNTLLFANCEDLRSRKNVVLKGSTDNGQTWPLRRVIDADHGGYVETAADPDAGLVYVLYEDDGGVTDTLAVLDDFC